MILFFGVRTAHISSEPNPNAVCDNCNTQGSLIMHIFRSHVHLFWIPIFPLRKSGYTQCTHCKHVIEPYEMSESLRNQFLEVKKETNGPIWQFAGLLLLIAIIFFFFFTMKS